MKMASNQTKRAGTVLRAGVLAMACALPWMASAQMVVYWPSSGGASTSLGALSDIQQPILTNMSWHGEDTGMRSHLELATPVPQRVDAGYAVSGISSEGFSLALDASIQREFTWGQDVKLAPVKAGASMGVYFDLTAATALRIQTESSSEFGLYDGVFGTDIASVSLVRFTTINGVDKEATVWSSTWGSFRDDALLHLDAGIYQLRAATSTELVANRRGENLPDTAITLNVGVSVVPEPEMASLWGLGLMGVAAAARHGRIKRQR